MKTSSASASGSLNISGDAPRVLLVEDCQVAQTLLRSCLDAICRVTIVENLRSARQALTQQKFDLAILDVSLPDGNGFEFCEKYLRAAGTDPLPVIFVTGETHITQKVRGFQLNAEDYITKPIEPEEFTARIAAHLRNIGLPAQTNAPYLVRGEFWINLSTHAASIKKNSADVRELNLTPTEFKLLVHFLRNEKKLVSRDELRRAAWGNKIHVTSHTVDTHLSALRKKLGPEARYLQAVIRKGYRFAIEDLVAEVS